MMHLSCLSLNVNGLRDGLKRSVVLSLAREYDIVFLQETHFQNTMEADKFLVHWQGSAFHSMGTSNSRGVSILLSSQVHGQNVQSDLDGRCLVVEIEFQGLAFRLINVYCPNEKKDRLYFLSSLFELCTTSKKVILGGDFNCVDSVCLDKVGGNPDLGDGGSEILKDLCSICTLSDVFRSAYPNGKEYTFSKRVQGNLVKTRLDRFYVSKEIVAEGCITLCDHLETNLSDHSLVRFKCNLTSLTGLTQGGGYWKCNVNILSDNSFKVAMEKLWYEDLAPRSPRDGEWWELCKNKFRKLIIYHCKKAQSSFKTRLQELEGAVLDLKQHEKYELVPGTFAPIIKETLNEIENLLLKRHEGCRIRSRIDHLNYDDRSSRYFLRKENKHGSDRFISYLKYKEKHLKSSDTILSACVDFYKDLFSAEKTESSLQQLFLNNLPKLGGESAGGCEGILTYEECMDAIKRMKNGKTPGLDGLPKEFYERYFYLFGDDFVEMVNDCFKSGKKLPLSMRCAVITLLCKDQENSFLIKNWRPISLLNLDYKLVSKVLSTRLRGVLGDIVSPYQTCSVPGRSIMDNLHLFRNIISYANQKSFPLAFINIDQEKAFDRVDHQYLFKVLESFGFKQNFLSWIKLLYNDVFTSVLVNGHISEAFSISRSVRQGCSLSPLLYVLCLEPLVHAIRRHPEIIGLPVPLSPEPIKVSLYADDLTVITTSETSIQALLCILNTYASATGTRINRQKSSAIFLGSWSNRKDSPGGFKWESTIKLLGIVFNRDGPDSEATWQKVYEKLKRVLYDIKDRSRTLYGRALLLNALALSKLWYVSSICSMSPSWVIKFNKLVYKFLWNQGHEWLARTTTCLPKLGGGVAMVNIELKIQAFLIKHVLHLILKFGESDSPSWVYLARYWLGMKLRNYNESLFSNNVPNSVLRPGFYEECYKAFHYFTTTVNQTEYHRMTVKNIYRTLIRKQGVSPVVIGNFPHINFSRIWRTIQIGALSPEEKDLNFRCAHGILPVKAYLNRCHFGLTSELCYMCESDRETLNHMFLECERVQGVWNFIRGYLLKLCNHRLKLNYRTVVLSECPSGVFLTLKHKHLFWMIVSIIKLTIWYERNMVKHNKVTTTNSVILNKVKRNIKERCRVDYERLPWNQFVELWAVGGDFVNVESGSYVVQF